MTDGADRMMWESQLASGRVLLIDGGTGSELRRRGVDLSPIAWSGPVNLEHYRLLVEIHSDYIAAGADVVTANTFGTTRFVLEAAGLGDRFDEVNLRAIEAAIEAREASGRDVAIAASLSCLPSGFDVRAYPEPAVELDAYRELAQLFAKHGVEIVLLEMMQDSEHARRACEAASECGVPFWLGLSCRLKAQQARKRSGNDQIGAVSPALEGFDLPGADFDSTLDALLPSEPSVVCVMHSPVDAIVPALERVRTRWPGVLGAYAEIGYPEDPAAAAAERMSPEAYATEARRWLDAGARVIGGCCGTTPDHVRALGEIVAE